MWIKKQVLDDLRHTAKTLETLAKQYYDGLQARNAEIKRLQAREIELLRELGVKIATESRATAVADIWRLRVNELTVERAALLEKLVPGIKMAVPVVERGPMVMPPGIDFDDIGDAAAQMTGALTGDGELRVTDPAPAGVKGTASLFSDPDETLDEQ